MNSISGTLLLVLAVLAIAGILVVLIHDSKWSFGIKQFLYGLTSFSAVLGLGAVLLPFY